MLITKIRKKTHLIMWLFLGIFVIGGVFLTYGVFMPGSRGQGPTAKKSSVPNDVLSVDGQKVSLMQFESGYSKLKRNYESMGGMRFDTYPMQMYLKMQALEMMTTQQLLLQEAKKRGVRADSAEVAKRIKQEQEFLLGPETKAGGAGAGDSVKKFFAAKEREKEFRDSLNRTGVLYETFKLEIQNEVKQSKVVELIAADQMKVETANARKKALDVIEKLKTGEPFEKVAAQFSEDEASKNNGGDLGWVKRGMLPQPIEQASFALQPGQVAQQPVETPEGFHIIQLLQKKEAVGPEFESQKNQIIASIRAQKGDETLKVSMDEIKNAYEAFHARDIVIRMKTKDQIAQEWIQNERTKGKHKIDIINPELNAYKYLYGNMFSQTAAPPDLDKAIKLYEKAADADPANPYPYYELGNIYKQKYSKDEIKKAGGENDPYAKAISEEKKAAPAGSRKAGKDEENNMKEALREYKRANEVAIGNNIYDPILLITLGDTAKTLGEHKVAIDSYAEAVDFSAGNKQYLTQIKNGLEGYKSAKVVKALKDVNELLAELDAIEKENAKKAAEANPAPEAPAAPVPPEGVKAVKVQKPGAQNADNQQPAGSSAAQAGKPLTVRTFKVQPGGKAVEVLKKAPVAKPAATPVGSNASPTPAEAPTPPPPPQPAPQQ
ncbi:MAG: peptidylprolyl isomerase [bacterium]